jgi:hypothetical protein
VLKILFSQTNEFELVSVLVYGSGEKYYENHCTLKIFNA